MQTLLLPTNRDLHMAYLLAYLHLMIAHSKDQCQGHAHFDWISCKWCHAYLTLLLPQILSPVSFWLAYLELILTYSKSQLSRRNGVSPNSFALLLNFRVDRESECFVLSDLLVAFNKPVNKFNSQICFGISHEVLPVNRFGISHEVLSVNQK